MNYHCDACGETMAEDSDMYETHDRWCAEIEKINKKYENLMKDRYGKPGPWNDDEENK